MQSNLDSILMQHEHARLEAKAGQGGLPSSLWSSYSAFANTDGGTILIGVEEKKNRDFKVLGVTDAEQMINDFWNMIHNPSKVSANVLTNEDVCSIRYEDKEVIVIQVPRVDRSRKPVYINGNVLTGTYRRDSQGDYRCTEEEVGAMLRDKNRNALDALPIMHMGVDVLLSDTVTSYRNRHMAHRPGHVWEKLSEEEYLQRIGAVVRTETDGKLHPTGAGLLMFGEEYIILRQYPGYFLDFRDLRDPSIRWMDRLQSSSGEWSGNLFDFFFRVYPKLVRDVAVPFQLEGIVRVDDTPVHRAIREALANCLINADYQGTCGVLIKKEADAVVLENPGSIRTGKAQMLRGGVSDPRNPTIMKMFNLIGIGERAGSGVPDILRVWESEGWEPPTVEESRFYERTTLRLPFLPKSTVEEALDLDKPGGQGIGDKSTAEGNELNDSATKANATKLNRRDAAKRRILTAVSSGHEKTTEIARNAGFSVSWTRELLGEMVREGILEAQGATKKKEYRITNMDIQTASYVTDTVDEKRR